MSSTICIILVCVLSVVCLLLAVKLYQFSILIIKIEDAIEESLDILNERYSSINEVLKKPVFFDSVEIRQVISDIRECHRAVLLIANILTKDMRNLTNEIKKEDNQEKEK